MAKNKEQQAKKPTLSRKNITKKQLNAQADQKSEEILQRIHENTIRISEAKKEAALAGSMPSGAFGKTARKTNANTKTLLIVTTALSEMNDLIQESVRFTCSSIELAQVMHKNIKNKVANGFKGTDGKIIRLSEDSDEAMKAVDDYLDEVEDFIAGQKATEKKSQDLEKKQYELSLRQDEKDLEYSNLKKRLQKLEKEQAENIQRIMDGLRLYKIVTLVLSITAMVVSLGTLVFFILQKY